jgi:hypothetical protein
MSAPVLQITTRDRVDPSVITINGAAYRLRSKEDLSWAQTIRYSELHLQLVATRAAVLSPSATAEDEAALAAIVDELLVMALEAPEDLLLALRRDYKLSIIAAAFFEYRPPAPPAEKTPVTAETTPAMS